ncbi:outer membrane beta-barrel protein [Pseudomonadales bacterium]|nr:outer membrane beta-barrel protein [Pseudomonadales bacterium]
MTTAKYLFAVAGIAVALPTIAAVQPQAVDIGAMKLIPTLGVMQRYDDNIFRQATDEVNSWSTILTPQLQLLAEQDANKVALTYLGDYGRYSSSSDDNYYDHTVSLDAQLEANDQHRFVLGASMAKLHDARGEGSSEGVIAISRPEPDEYDANSLSANYDFGRESARFGLELSADTTDIEYQNNLLETQFRNRQDTGLGGKFYGRLASKTRFFVELAQTDIEYDVLPLSEETLNSDEQNVSLGVDWEVTGKTSGSVQVGRLSKDFDAAGKAGTNLTNWSANVLWAPRTYSYLTIAISKQLRETNGTGSFIESTDYTTQWNHDWSDFLHATLEVGFGNENYADDPRTDDRMSYGLAVNYDVDRWVNISAGYRYTERDSNNNTFDFERSQVMLGVNLSL